MKAEVGILAVKASWIIYFAMLLSSCSEIRINQIADWMEKQEENSERRMLKEWAADTKEELSLANKELTAVRRAQLQKLLYTEHALYEMELNAHGKSFFIQRT